MTHDKLLATTRLGDGFQIAYSIAYALKTVIELHRPVKDDYLGYVGMDACESCCSPVSYPCPTIQAIETALNA